MTKKKEKTIHLSDFFDVFSIYDPSIKQSTNPWFNLFLDLMIPIRYCIVVLLAMIGVIYGLSGFGFLLIALDYSKETGIGFYGWTIIILNSSVILILLVARILDFNEELKNYKKE